MYNKIRKALDSMLYIYRECESCRLFKDIHLGEGFIVFLRERDLYIELTDDGIEIWNYNTSEYIKKIEKEESYIMMFRLGSYIQFLNR